MRLEPYPNYKPSGVDWLGNVPVHWEVKRLKYSASINDEALPETTLPDFEFEYVDIGGVSAVDGITTTEQVVFENAPSRARRKVRHGDTIVSTVRTYLRAIAPIKNPPANLIVSTGFAVVRPRKVESTFLAYALRESSFIESVVARSTGVSYPAVNASEVGGIPIPLPDSTEQRSIAAFLDRETGRVDRLVAKKRELIERLKEKRTSRISRTVTRGLPPAAARAAGLPENPPLKPSALEWLGEIPAHWEVKKLGYSAYLQGGYAFASEKFDSEGVPVVRMNNLKRGALDTSDASCVAPENCLDDFALAEGDLLWGMSGSIGKTGSLGNFARVRAGDLPAQLNQRVGRFCVIGDSIALGFLTYVIQTKFFYDQILLRVTGTAQFNISSEQVQSEKVPFPPLHEQAAIAAYLDEETAKLDALVGKVEEAVERLQEYRTALITAAVTGKIDVRKEIAA